MSEPRKETMTAAERFLRIMNAKMEAEEFFASFLNESPISLNSADLWEAFSLAEGIVSRTEELGMEFHVRVKRAVKLMRGRFTSKRESVTGLCRRDRTLRIALKEGARLSEEEKSLLRELNGHLDRIQKYF